MARIFTPMNYGRLLQYVLDNGEYVDVNESKTIEIVNANLILKNPRDRLVISDERKINFPFGIAEFIGLITGESRVAFFNNFISGYEKYSTDGVIVDGAYGARMLIGEDKNQIIEVIRKLTLFPDSRRAVISIYNGPSDLMGESGKNTPCTLTFHFLIRNEQLHLITNMRSNDAIWGFNYDLMMFTMLQEYIATRLGLGLGNYFHNAGSFHIYESHWPLSKRMIKETTRWPRTMERMPLEFDHNEIYRLRDIYFNIQDEDMFADRVVGLQTKYAANLAFAGYVFYHRREKRAKEALLMIRDYTIRKVLRPWIHPKL